MKQLRQGCGLFTLAEWVSSVCKDSDCPWWDPHSPSDIWEALNVIPADLKKGKLVMMFFWGEDRDLNHCEPQWFKSLCPPPTPIPLCMAKTNLEQWSEIPKTAAFLFCLLIVWIHTPTVLLSPLSITSQYDVDNRGWGDTELHNKLSHLTLYCISL